MKRMSLVICLSSFGLTAVGCGGEPPSTGEQQTTVTEEKVITGEVDESGKADAPYGVCTEYIWISDPKWCHAPGDVFRNGNCMKCMVYRPYGNKKYWHVKQAVYRGINANCEELLPGRYDCDCVNLYLVKNNYEFLGTAHPCR